MTDTSIRISSENRDDLKRLQPDLGQKYDDVIAELIEQYRDCQGDVD